MTGPKVRAVFFDLFGTLLLYGDMRRAWRDWLETFHDRLGHCGLRMPKEQFARKCENFFSSPPPPAEDDFTVFERRIRALASSLGLSLTPNSTRATADCLVQAWQQHITADPDATGVLTALREERSLGLISNFDHPRHARKVLATHGLDGFFRTIVISGEVGVAKPDPEIFARALDETGMRPCDTVYVGDTDEDMEAARAAGIAPVLIRRSNGGTDRQALDYTNSDAMPAPTVIVPSGSDSVTRISALGDLLAVLG